MSSEDMGLVPSQRLENGLNSHLVFQEDSLRFNCGAPNQRRVGDPGPKTRDLSGFIDERFFAPQGADFRRSMFGDGQDRREAPEARNWNGNGTTTTPSVDGSDEDDDDDDEEDDVDEDDDVDDGVEGLVGADGNLDKGNSSNNLGNGEDKMGNGKAKHHHHSSPFGVNMMGPEGSASGQKDLTVENGCEFSGRKDVLYSNESGESLRTILSDPVTGALMDDAMILPCGHSFGDGGIQHVIRLKACYTCSQSISETSISPNLSLRAAVQAFRREEELQFHRSSKRRRERFDQDKGIYGDCTLMDLPRGRGVQFPFAVTDRVIIKGNKRTPQRFVGREAVVTTQCLNGWYVVKTLDNAESVKLQYRSLAKVSDDPIPKPMSSKMVPNWL
ncbi:hypothetical protein G4B88_029513 [Cannabis sativa]|uniref:U-box domain-containing protein n=1 Tax=Cannabis sativa TaxID=3483 RepID=A0A7J6DUJ0_CANSA|nr:hypothetical protein G4B88_029513 [Cannabis sativa]